MIATLPKLKRYSSYVAVSVTLTISILYSMNVIFPLKPADRAGSYAKSLLALTRSIITLDMWDYQFHVSGVRRLEELVPAAGGAPMRSVIVSTWRSGSSFLGQLVASAPASLYFYEPLKSIDLTAQLRHLRDPRAADALALLKNLMKINLDNKISRSYFEWLQGNPQTLDAKWHRSRFWDECRHNLCFDVKFLTIFFKLFPTQVYKLDRLRMDVAEHLLLDEGLNVKLVLLVRDPRGVLFSRQRIKFFPRVRGAMDPASLCRDLARDHRAAQRLATQHPGRVMVVRFEDLALNLYSTAEQVFQYLQLDLTRSVRSFMQAHSNASHDPAPYSTYRVSKNVPFQWKEGFNSSVIRYIETQCEEAMSLWGYERVTQGSNSIGT